MLPALPRQSLLDLGKEPTIYMLTVQSAGHIRLYTSTERVLSDDMC